MQDDAHWMRRAVRLAMNGRGRVEPNPMVGCVIVKDGRAIGEGYHQQFGGPHAEPNALAACTESPAGAAAYVTLEPCCHTDKKTPPCVPKLVEAKVARVVIGCIDPDPRVNGRGAEQLRGAGIEVTSGVLDAECKQLLAPFIAYVVQQRPYVTLKWAQSRNGMVAGRMGRRVKITGDASDRIVHELRARSDAIAVGTNTVLNDDPLLTARASFASRNPARVVLSNSLKLPETSRLVQSARQHPLWVFASAASVAANEPLVGRLRAAGVDVTPLPDHDGRFSFADVLAHLHARAVVHLLVEPGPTLTRYFLARGQADRVWVFRSNNDFEEDGALAISSAPPVDYPATGRLAVDAADTLAEYLNPDSAVYFTPEPSADFVLASAGSAW
jgi:diaminohydroxyphosphoribosylaminopyrimidine deaminase/5-amino-6-(5-phosphoribosylamino)uracil reductase